MRCSVVIPMFNGAPAAERAVASVLAQQRPADEIIVVDDGSTDGSADRLRTTYPAVTVIEQENRGPGPARNAGIERARAEWIALLDADDVWLPWHLDQLADTARAVPDARVVAGGFVARSPGGPPPAPGRGRPRRIDYFREAARDIGVVHSSTVAIHREALQRIGGFGDARRGQDLELWARLALAVPVAANATTSAVYTLGVGITAAFERETAGRPPQPVPTELRALSPSCRVVADALDTGDHLPPARSLRRYLDSRLAWTMRVRLAAGDVEGARELRSLASSAVWPENLGPMLAGALPPVLVRPALEVRRWTARRTRMPRRVRRSVARQSRSARS